VFRLFSRIVSSDSNTANLDQQEHHHHHQEFDFIDPRRLDIRFHDPSTEFRHSIVPQATASSIDCFRPPITQTTQQVRDDDHTDDNVLLLPSQSSQQQPNPGHSTPQEPTLVTHTCEKCPKTFPERWQLNRHVTTKHDLKFRCDVPSCPAKFGLRKDLRRHTKAKHPERAADSARHSCPAHGCTYTSTRRDNCDRHVRKQHPEAAGVGRELERADQPVRRRRQKRT